MACLWIASPAGASVTIGQLPPGGISGCAANQDMTQATVAEGPSYTVPASEGIVSWTISSWSTKANAVAVQEMTLKVFRPLGGLVYSAVTRDGPRPLKPSETNVFTSSVVVQAGDVLGLHNSTNAAGCAFPTGMGPPDTSLSRSGNLPDGQSGTFMTGPNQRVNIAAVIEPTNSFNLGKVKLNKRKGTATLAVEVPNPGTLTGSGKGVRASGRGAAISRAVSAPGTARLRIKAEGRRLKTLNATGKVKLKAKVTFTPNGGEPRTRSTKLRLKKS